MLLWFVIAYLALSIAIGLYAATRVHNARDYIVAGRNLPFAVVLAMVFATWFGAETVLGISATFLEEGFHGLISDPLGASLCLVLFGLIFARPLYRMNLLTLGDFFRRRYNPTIEMVLSICIVISYLGWVGAQMTALGVVFNALTNGAISNTQGTLIGALVVLVYTIFGGMWSVAWTTFVQMIVIVIGLFLVALYAGDLAGGLAPVVDKAAAEGKLEWLPERNWLSIFTWISALITMALGSIPQQDVFQRVNSSKNEFVAVWATTLGGICYFLFAAVPLFIAYSATVIDPQLVQTFLDQDSQLILPLFVTTHMPLWLQIVFFGALLSVIMSTASGTLLAPSVTFTENILKSTWPTLTDRQLLLATRLTVVAFTLIVLVYALWSNDSIHGMVEKAYRVTLAGAFVPLVAGIFWKRANSLGATFSVILGIGTWLFGELVLPESEIEPQIYGFLASIVGMVTGTLLGPKDPHLPKRTRQHNAASATHHVASRR
ncbi:MULTISPECIES: sodium:solute symporter family protein [Tepidiphilus]|uniref:sodium:solute symporter family protein n=1 Tax=Tepidiphilus TaxID=203470 RepID=UPI00115E0531|nr:MULTISPECIES: sodium:solute symporter family protein [Tepidiphilus]